MRESPSLAELRGRVQKGRHREIGNVLARRYGRPLAVYGTWLAVRLGVTANQVTLAALVCGLAGGVGLGLGSWWGLLAGVAGLLGAFLLDHVDGQVARWRGTASLDGVFLDYLMHHALALVTGFGLGYGLMRETGEPVWSVAGFVLGGVWLGLGVVNDCRYKALFQRLKATGATYRVEGGSGGRPAPAPGWPRRGVGVVTWPAAKMCEPHVVLICLSVMCVASLIVPGIRVGLLMGYVGGVGVVGMGLLAGRVARVVRRGGVEGEFAAWFREEGMPVDGSGREAA